MSPTALPSPSALSQLINSYSAYSSNNAADSDPNPSAHPSSAQDALPLEILHNLRHQHYWSSLSLHPSPSSPLGKVPSSDTTLSPPVTLLSGLPPHPLYISPARQSYLLDHRLSAEKDVPTEREWVLPLAIGGEERWTLRRFAAVFDALPEREPWLTAESRSDGGGRGGGNSDTAGGGKRKEGSRDSEGGREGEKKDAKRILLAMQANRQRGGDGMVTYYFMLEGDVKPRQN